MPRLGKPCSSQAATGYGPGEWGAGVTTLLTVLSHPIPCTVTAKSPPAWSDSQMSPLFMGHPERKVGRGARPAHTQPY